MEINLNLDEMSYITNVLRENVKYYEHLKMHVETDDGWICYDLNEKEAFRIYKKFWDAYEAYCKEIGELPF